MKYNFTIKNHAGREMEVLQQIPNKGNTFGTIILVPGFGVDLHEYGLFDDLSNTFIKNGFQTWRFSFEGTGNSEGDFTQATVESQTKQLRDILSAVVKDRYTDIENISILAYGYGATIATAALPISEIKTLLFISPIANPYETLSKMYKRQRGFFPKEISQLERPNKDVVKVGPQFWSSIGRHNLVGKIKKATQPMLFIYGTHDRKVKQYSVAELFNAATAPKKVHLIQKADHGFTGKFRPTLCDLAVDWFEKTSR